MPIFSYENAISHFHMNGCVPSLALIERLKATRKWAITVVSVVSSGGNTSDLTDPKIQPRFQGTLSTSRKYPGYGWSRV